MEAYASKLKELKTLYSNTYGRLRPVDNAEIEAVLTDAEKLVDDLKDNTEQLKSRTTLYLYHHLFISGQLLFYS